MLTLFKTTSSPWLFPFDCITLYLPSKTVSVMSFIAWGSFTMFRRIPSPDGITLAYNRIQGKGSRKELDLDPGSRIKQMHCYLVIYNNVLMYWELRSCVFDRHSFPVRFLHYETFTFLKTFNFDNNLNGISILLVRKVLLWPAPPGICQDWHFLDANQVDRPFFKNIFFLLHGLFGYIMFGHTILTTTFNLLIL